MLVFVATPGQGRRRARIFQFSEHHENSSCLPFCRPSGKPREAAPVAAPVPRPFDFGFSERRPLVPLPAVMMFLDRTANEVVELIEDGKLRWAFDIRTTKAGSREVRILRQSLFEYTGLLCARAGGGQAGYRERGGAGDHEPDIAGRDDDFVDVVPERFDELAETRAATGAAQACGVSVFFSFQKMLFSVGAGFVGDGDCAMFFVQQPAHHQSGEGGFDLGGESAARAEGVADYYPGQRD